MKEEQPFWRPFDCAFGAFGILPLWIVRRDVRGIVALERTTPTAP